MPFKSDKQRRFLWSQKPEVAKQIAYKQSGGVLDYADQAVAWHNANLAGQKQDLGSTADAMAAKRFFEENPNYWKERGVNDPTFAFDAQGNILQRGDVGAEGQFSSYMDTPLARTIPERENYAAKELARQAAVNEELKAKAAATGFKFQEGGEVPMMDNRKPKKIIQKDRYGNQLTFEFPEETKPVDPTKLMEKMMDMQVPEMETPEVYDHPGEPQGTDTVPAWLTPGEFVVNAEATQMYGPEIEAMNNQGRAVQQAQGGMIPQGYQMGGQVERPIPPDPLQNTHASAFQQGLKRGEYRQDMAEYINHLLQQAAGPKEMYRQEGGAVPVGFTDYLLQQREGYRPDVYEDSRGFPTVGTGHQLPPEYLDRIGEQPFTEDQLGEFYQEDKGDAEAAAKRNAKHYGVDWDSLGRGEKGALTSMAFQLGETGQKNFENMWTALAAGDKDTAATEALMSDWAYQTPKRAKDVFNALSGFSFQEGGMVPQYYQGGGLTDFWNSYIAGPRTQIPTEPSLDYGWNVDAGRPYTAEEGIAAGTVPPQIFDEADPAGDEYLMQQQLQNQPGPMPRPPEDPYQGGPIPTEMIDQGRADEMFFENIPELPAEQPPEPGDHMNWFQKNILGPELQPEDPSIGSIGPDPAIDEVADLYGAAAASGQDLKHLERYGPTEATVEELYHQKADKDDDGKVSKDEDKQATVESWFESSTQEAGDQSAEVVQPKEEVSTAGEQAPPAEKKQAESFIKSAFGDLFDGGELKRMAVLYLGSRVLGNSHVGSLQWAAKNYVTRVDAKTANRDKYAVDLAKSGKYSTESINEYKKTGDLSKLSPVGVTYETTGDTNIRSINGKKVAFQEVKDSSGNVLYKDPAGNSYTAAQLENASRPYEPSFDKGTPEYRARRSRATGDSAARFEEVWKAEDTFRVGSGHDTSVQHHTNIRPKQAADEFWSWAEQMNIDPESDEALQIMTNAYQQAIADGKNEDTLKPSRLRPYLEAQYIRESTGYPDLFITNPEKVAEGKEQPKYLDQKNMHTMQSNIETFVAASPADISSSQVYSVGVREWNKLGDDQDIYEKKGKKAGTTGFYVFMEEKLSELYASL